MFKCNLQPAGFTMWPWSFTCHRGNIGFERMPNKRQHRKLSLDQKILRLARQVSKRNLLTTNPSLSQDVHVLPIYLHTGREMANFSFREGPASGVLHGIWDGGWGWGWERILIMTAHVPCGFFCRGALLLLDMGKGLQL